MYINNDQTIDVADTYNHRIVEWTSVENNGQVVDGRSGKGHRNDQLNESTNVIVDKNGFSDHL